VLEQELVVDGSAGVVITVKLYLPAYIRPWTKLRTLLRSQEWDMFITGP